MFRTRHFRHHGFRTAPLEPGTGTVDNGGAPVVPPAPVAFDPASLTAEQKAYVDAQVKAAADKSRGYDKAAAAKAERDAIKAALAKALGDDPAALDPAAVATELAAARETNRQLLTDRAVERAARAAGADDDLVAGKLMRDGSLKGLDPAAPDFGDKVKTLVDAAVLANPRLKLDATPVAPVTPAAGKAPVAVFTGTGEQGSRPTLGAALAAQMAGNTK